jgi:hypothetical protein
MEYTVAVLDENGDEVGEVIELALYLAGNKNPSQLLDEINSRIDKHEDDEDDE